MTSEPRWTEIPLIAAVVLDSDGTTTLVESALSFKVTLPPATSIDASSDAAAEAAPIEWSAGVWEYKQTWGNQCGSVSWAGGLPAHDSWHSLALNVKCRRGDKESPEALSNGGDGDAASIDLVIDGSNRIRKDEGRPGTTSGGNRMSNISSLARSWFDAFETTLNPSAGARNEDFKKHF
jgi:hypothetical protein